jgi:16S rRNA (adenine1518-N6/adenine1519-N6)-dimethyltransferase
LADRPRAPRHTFSSDRRHAHPAKPRPPRELAEAGLTARKALGQHFLRDRAILRRIAAATKASPEETVIEVGAGLGVLTQQLAKRAGRVIAVEVDATLCDHLRRRFDGLPAVSVVSADVLALPPSELLRAGGARPPYVLAGNLPYNIGAAVLRHFLEAAQPPQRLIVMLQREVAESIVAAPGRLSLLALSVRFYGSPRLLFTVPPAAFYPPPKVDSAVLRIDVHEAPPVAVDDTGAFFRFLRAGFSAPRKQLRNALSHGLAREPRSVGEAIARAGLDPSLRAQALSLDDWATLYRALAVDSEERQ